MLTQNKDFLVEGPILPSVIAELVKNANNSDIGAHSIFIGQVRKDSINGQPVTGIEYSAYAPMVEHEMQNIINTVTLKYADTKIIHILHATGLVQSGEISLLVFVACGHRRESFKAMEEIVELIKERIPIWKKEILDDNSHQWPDNKNM